MIVQIYMVILTLSVGLISDVTCEAFSNVYVERDVVPTGYYSYGIPYPSVANPRLSQINSLPSVPGYVTVHPAHTANHEIHNPNVVTYHAPSAPVVIAPTKQEPTGYEYSYVVYDQNTGDHKAQRELSDGSVVRGEYSFLQPDGYVREVQYVADDASGFNAVVKKFLPAAVEGTKNTKNEHKESPPCHDAKSESLKEGSEKHSGAISTHHKTHSSEESHEKSKKHTQHSTSKETHNHSKTKASHEEEHSKENHHLKPKHSNEESHEKTKTNTYHTTSKENNHHNNPKESHEEENSDKKHHLKPKHSKEQSHEENHHFKPKHSKEQSHEENHHSKSKQESEESSSEESEEVNHKKSKESAGASKEKHHKDCKTVSKESEEESEEESESEESKENLRNISSEESDESKENNSHGKHHEAHELLKPSNGAVVPYKDLIRCIEAAMKRNHGGPAAIRQEHSPLTYIVLNKPC